MDNNVQNNEPLTKKQKADAAGKDIAEVVARGAGRYYGGALGGAAVDAALNTKAGQRVISGAGKKLSRSNLVSRNLLANNQQNIHRSKPMINSLVGGMMGTSTSGVNEENDYVDSYDESVSDNKLEGTGVVSGLWKKMSLKTKLIIIGILFAFVSLIMFLIILITPLMKLGIIDTDDVGGSTGSGASYGYSSVSDSVNHYFPIGSTQNGVTVDSGVPAVTAITSYYSSQEDFRTSVHGGIDIGNGGNGAGVINIIASKSGKVIYPTSTSQISFSDDGYYGNTDGAGFGNYVIIEHNDSTTTVYAHLSKDSITVMAGDNVSQGQVIGKMGNSGSSTGTHLHYEVRVNGNRVDPMNYISTSNTRPKY